MITPKFPSAGTNIFTVMSALANECKAINLSQGFPDFAIDAELGELVAQAIAQGYNQYAPMAGLLALRQAIADKISFFQKVFVDPDAEITVTPGATYAIYTALTAILQPGDEVIVLEPAYDSYIPNIYINGAFPVCISLDAANGFKVNWDKVFAAVTSRTKAIVINNPHNPSGAAWTESDFQFLISLVTRHNLYVLADEVYEHLVFDDKEHISILRFPELRERSFAVFSFGKVLHSTGWKLGYVVAPPLLTNAFRQLHQYFAFSVNTPMQQAVAVYLSNYRRLENTKKSLQSNRNFFWGEMQSTRFTFDKPSAGSYFQIMDYSAISDLPDKDFAIWLTQNHGVATIPVSAFYKNSNTDRLVRFCFAKKEETLRLAIDKLLLV